jgi:hypothetical protein
MHVREAEAPEDLRRDEARDRGDPGAVEREHVDDVALVAVRVQLGVERLDAD